MVRPESLKRIQEKKIEMKEDYRVLLTLGINHEYIEDESYRLMDIQLCRESILLLRNRQMIFKRESPGQWMLIGNVEGSGVDEECDVLGLEFVLKDAAFMYYTEWEGFDADVAYTVDLTGCEGKVQFTEVLQTIPKKGAGVLFTGRLRLSMELFRRARKGESYTISLNFMAKEMFWEYWFVPRKPENQPGQLLVEEANGELLFSEPQLAEVDFIDKKVYRCVSRTAIKMKERYDFRLDLWEIVQQNPERKRKILKNIEHPVPGRFHDLRGNNLRQIVYF